MAASDVALVWAQARDGVIGADGRLPWELPEDLAHFKALTTGATVLMGRATWESLPARFRPLPGRRNLVLTRQVAFAAEGAEVVSSVAEALGRTSGVLWVIGGGQVYRAALEYAREAVVTEIDLDIAGDTTAPSLGAEWSLASADPEAGWHRSRSGLGYRFRTYRRVAPVVH